MAVTWKRLCFEDDAVLLNGRSGGQTLYGGTGIGQSLALHSTGNATKGEVQVWDNEFRAYSLYNASGAIAFNLNSVTALRTITFPNDSGTIVLSSTFNNYPVTINSTALTGNYVREETIAVTAGTSSIISSISISGGAQEGMIKHLYFESPITVTHNAAVIKLKGDVNLDALAGDMLSLGYFGGIWREMFRDLF